MPNKLKQKFRPYLVMYSENALPVVAKSFKEFKTDLEPQLHNMAKAFANHKTNKLQHKFCVQNCTPNKKCISKCLEERKMRQNELILIDKVESRLMPLIRGLQRGEDPDTIVMIECREFACSGLILSLYSKLFKALRGQTVIDLRNGPLTLDIFEQIYKWMVKPNYDIMSKDVVRILRGATFLEIPDLLEQFYTLFDGNLYYELRAFDIMYRSRKFSELNNINRAMANRISKSTLIILCSQEFLKLNEMQVKALTSSSFLAVNSETEILFGVLHWLQMDWPSRKHSVLKLMRTIRFAYLSPNILCQLNEIDLENIGPFTDALKEFYNLKESKRLIEDGIFYSTLVITATGENGLKIKLPGAKKNLMVPRRWVRDSRCPYHRPVTTLCPNMRCVPYAEFVAYSDILQNSDVDYEKYFHYPGDKKITESSSNSKLSFLVTDTEGAHWTNPESSLATQKNAISTTQSTDEYKSPLHSPREDWNKEDFIHWLENQKHFYPSDIWEEWEGNLLYDRSESARKEK